ncbi:MAG: hypothetical protein GY832_13365 [Chloroflexi bacterium]|nr:hypothetical protein [Chloroflexota bacterium]
MDFGQVEARVAKLRQSLAAGHLTDDQFKFQLREMMVEDENGNWWMIGYETGEWYRHDGTDWVRADPSRRIVTKPLSRLKSHPTNAANNPQPRRFKRVTIFMLGLTVTSIVSLMAGQLAWETILDHDDATTWVFASIVWISGFIVTLIVARKV